MSLEDEARKSLEREAIGREAMEKAAEIADVPGLDELIEMFEKYGVRPVGLYRESTSGNSKLGFGRPYSRFAVVARGWVISRWDVSDGGADVELVILEDGRLLRTAYPRWTGDQKHLPLGSAVFHGVDSADIDDRACFYTIRDDWRLRIQDLRILDYHRGEVFARVAKQILSGHKTGIFMT